MFQSKTFVILTGASKGFGQALACSLARELSKDNVAKESVLVLTARSEEGLKETKRMVAEISSSINGGYSFRQRFYQGRRGLLVGVHREYFCGE